MTGGAARGKYGAQFAEDVRFVMDALSSHHSREVYGQLQPQIHLFGAFQDPKGPLKFYVYVFALSETNIFVIMSGDLLTMGGTAERVTRWSR